MTGQDACRAATRRLVAGVTVLTVAHGNQAHGTTVSAVQAVSRAPLLVHAALRGGSVFAGMVGANDLFVVNLLSARQAVLADWFANPDRPAGVRQFDNVDNTADPLSGAPVLGHTIGWLSCRLTNRFTVGDSEILVAKVADGAVRPGPPLLSFAGHLHAVELRELVRSRGWRDPAGASVTTLD